MCIQKEFIFRLNLRHFTMLYVSLHVCNHLFQKEGNVSTLTDICFLQMDFCIKLLFIYFQIAGSQ